MRLNQLLSASLLVTTACTGEIVDDDMGTPSLLAISKAEISVGGTLEFLGNNYVDTKEGHTELWWQGEYRTDSGESEQVNIRVHPHWGSGSRLVWANFGPFQVPFSAKGDKLGQFVGTVTPVNVNDQTGSEHIGDAVPADLRVGPSVIVKDFQPVQATCEEPIKRMLGGFPYKITVEAAGLDPVNFTYEILDEPGLNGRPRVFRQPVEPGSHSATFGENYELFISEVPDGVNYGGSIPAQAFYVARIMITARDASGKEASTVYSFGVHRPIEYIDWGNPQVAQIEAAQPVTGCLSGGLNGQHFSYSETESDTRERQVSTHWDENWVQEHSGQFSTSHEERNGVSMSYTKGTEDGWSTEWQNGTSLSGGGGLSLCPLCVIGMSASVEAGATHSTGGGTHHSDSQSWTVGHDYSEADTESWAFTQSESHGVTTGASEFWSVSSTESISKEASVEVIPSMFAVWYRQASKIARPGSIAVYNLCGQPQWVGDSMFNDYVWAVSAGMDSACPPLPKPMLPDPQCVIAPCSGN